MRFIVLKSLVLLSLIFIILTSGCTGPTAKVGDSQTIDNITVTLVGVERGYSEDGKSFITGINITIRNDQKPDISLVRDNFYLYESGWREPFSVQIRPWWSNPDKHLLLSFGENMSVYLDMGRASWSMNAFNFNYNNKSVSWDLSNKV